MGMKGHCQCGAVQFETTLERPMAVYICHCLECRRQSSSTYGLTTLFPAFPFSKAASANLSVYSRTTLTNRIKDCYFCKKCGSRIYHHSEGQGLFTVKGGLLDGLSREIMDTAVHIWAKRAITPIPPEAEQYDEEPEESGEIAEGMSGGEKAKEQVQVPERVGVEERAEELEDK